MGLRDDGKRVILGLSVAVGEHEAHWRQLLQSLVQCGLTGVQLIVSDAHEGLQAARRAVFGGAPWQRCQFHLQQNVQAYAPQQELKAARQPIFARSSPHPIAPTPTACWRVSAEVRQNRIQAGHVARNGHSGGLDGA
jgi:Transposase and inactivated derivatives